MEPTERKKVDTEATKHIAGVGLAVELEYGITHAYAVDGFNHRVFLRAIVNCATRYDANHLTKDLVYRQAELTTAVVLRDPLGSMRPPNYRQLRQS